MKKYIRGLLIFTMGFTFGIVAMFVWLHRYTPSSYEECVESSGSLTVTTYPAACHDITGRVWIQPTYTPIEPTTTLNEQTFPQRADKPSCPFVLDLCEADSNSPSGIRGR